MGDKKETNEHVTEKFLDKIRISMDYTKKQIRIHLRHSHDTSTYKISHVTIA
jgi:hypothetical protein